MTVKIEFDTENEIFQNGNMEYEIIEILRIISNKIDDGYLNDSIHDTNGNNIGSFEVD